MKKLVLAGATVFALSGAPAFAADMPVKAPLAAPPAAMFTWTGFYVGATVGGIFVHDQISLPAFAFNGSNDSLSGVLGGPTLGFNYQFGSIVLGVEGDYSWTSAKGDVDFGCTPPCSEKIPYFATARVRAGYVVDNYLLYVTGGAAFTRIERSQTIPAGGSVDEGHANVTGWTVGAGVEAAIYGNWSLKAEYLFADFGHPDVFDPVVLATEHHDLTEQVARFGINYRFGGPFGARH